MIRALLTLLFFAAAAPAMAHAALVGTSPEIGDMVFSESNTAVKRALPLWPYASSDNVNRARNTYPQKMAINQCMSFVDYAWRFAMASCPAASNAGGPCSMPAARGVAQCFTATSIDRRAADLRRPPARLRRGKASAHPLLPTACTTARPCRG